VAYPEIFPGDTTWYWSVTTFQAFEALAKMRGINVIIIYLFIYLQTEIEG